jgi:hypothetical protein
MPGRWTGIILAKDSSSRQPILVTGAHRSGTTWVGKVLAADPQVAYISEPLNVWHRPGVMRIPIQSWYSYICPDNESEYYQALIETLSFQYHLGSEILSLRSIKDILRMGRDLSIFARGRYFHQRPLLKDPFAVFSAQWFAQRLGSQVVFVVRHPAAFVSSLIRLEWPFDLRDLSSQPLLMRDWLEPYRDEIERMLVEPRDVIAQGSLLWKMIYQVVFRLKEQRSDFHITRHEDLSIDPVNRYQHLYAALSLNYSPKVEETILTLSNPGNPKEVSTKAAHSVHLDSWANLKNWKKRMSREDIARIRQISEPVASLYYSEQDWE